MLDFVKLKLNLSFLLILVVFYSVVCDYALTHLQKFKTPQTTNNGNNNQRQRLRTIIIHEPAIRK